MSFHGFIKVFPFFKVVCLGTYHLTVTGNIGQVALPPSSQPPSIGPSMSTVPPIITQTETSQDSEDQGASSTAQHPDAPGTAGGISDPDHSQNDGPLSSNYSDPQSTDDNNLNPSGSHILNPSENDDSTFSNHADSEGDGDHESTETTDDKVSNQIYAASQTGKKQKHANDMHRPAKPLPSAKITQVDSDDSDSERLPIVRPRRARAPDLPLISPPLPKGNTSDIVSVPADKLSVKGVTAKLFFAESHVPPKDYEFKVSEKMVNSLHFEVLHCTLTSLSSSSQAGIEHNLLKRIQKSIEDGYMNGIPRHHHASAKMLDVRQGSSQFFVTTPEDFAQLSGEDVQGIFRDRHVLIPGGSSKRSSFSRKGLAELGSLYTPRDIQCSSVEVSVDSLI
jgi:hypothetical protein